MFKRKKQEPVLPPAPTVDSVLETFHKTVSDLEDVAQYHTEKAGHHLAQVHEHIARSTEAKAEAARATEIAERMKGIFQ